MNTQGTHDSSRRGDPTDRRVAVAQKRLEGYRKLENGKVQIPIERAMELEAKGQR